MLITALLGGLASFLLSVVAPAAAPPPTGELASTTATSESAIANPEPASRPAAAARHFVIGYLQEGTDLTHAPELMEALCRALLAHDPVRQALTRAGYDKIVPSPADGPRDMAQRMGVGEFDLVFATPLVYARQLGSRYEPVLQTGRRGDIKVPGRDGGVQRQGVIFIGPRSPLFDKLQPPSREDAAELLRRAPLAVPSGESAAGYLAPRLMMSRDLGLTAPPVPLFCGTDEEVIKSVVSGLVEVGACREEALNRLLPVKGDHNPYYRILLQPKYPMPTDPILLQRDLLPERSDLGRELVAALRDFFINERQSNAQREGAGDLRVENASRRDYELLAGYLAQLEEGRQSPTGPAMANPLAPATLLTPANPLTPDNPVPTTQTEPALQPAPPLAPVAAPTAAPTPAPTPAMIPALPEGPSAAAPFSPARDEAPTTRPAPITTPALPPTTDDNSGNHSDSGGTDDTGANSENSPHNANTPLSADTTEPTSATPGTALDAAPGMTEKLRPALPPGLLSGLIDNGLSTATSTAAATALSAASLTTPSTTARDKRPSPAARPGRSPLRPRPRPALPTASSITSPTQPALPPGAPARPTAPTGEPTQPPEPALPSKPALPSRPALPPGLTKRPTLPDAEPGRLARTAEPAVACAVEVPR